MVERGVEFQRGLSGCGGKWNSDESVRERQLYTVKANEGMWTKDYRCTSAAWWEWWEKRRF